MDSLFLFEVMGNVYKVYSYRFPLQVLEIVVEYREK